MPVIAAAASVQMMIVLTAAQHSGACLVLSAKMPEKSVSEVNACCAHIQLCCLPQCHTCSNAANSVIRWGSICPTLLSALEHACLSDKEVLADVWNTCQRVLPDSRQARQLIFDTIRTINMLLLLIAHVVCR